MKMNRKDEKHWALNRLQDKGLSLSFVSWKWLHFTTVVVSFSIVLQTLPSLSSPVFSYSNPQEVIWNKNRYTDFYEEKWVSWEDLYQRKSVIFTQIWQLLVVTEGQVYQSKCIITQNCSVWDSFRRFQYWITCVTCNFTSQSPYIQTGKVNSCPSLMNWQCVAILAVKGR